MNATDATQAAPKEHKRMLQVALTPPAVTLGVPNDVLRHFFVTALKVVCEPNLPVFLNQQSRLDEVVAQDMPSKWFAPGQVRQIAIQHERFCTNDGIVTPIISKTL